MVPAVGKRKVTKLLEKNADNQIFRTRLQNTKKNLGLGIITDSRRVKRLGSEDRIQGLKKAQLASCNNAHLKSHLKNVITSTPHFSKLKTNEFNSGVSFNNTGSLSPIKSQNTINLQNRNSGSSSEVEMPSALCSKRAQSKNVNDKYGSSPLEVKRSREVNGDANNSRPSVSSSPERKKLKTPEKLQIASSTRSKKCLSFNGLKPEESPKPDFVNRTPRRARPRTRGQTKDLETSKNLRPYSNRRSSQHRVEEAEKADFVNRTPRKGRPPIPGSEEGQEKGLETPQNATSRSKKLRTYSNRRSSQHQVVEVGNHECPNLTPLSTKKNSMIIDNTIVPSQTPVASDELLAALRLTRSSSKSEKSLSPKSPILNNASRREVVSLVTPVSVMVNDDTNKTRTVKSPESVMVNNTNKTRSEAKPKNTVKYDEFNNNKKKILEVSQNQTPKSVVPNNVRPENPQNGTQKTDVLNNSKRTISVVDERVQTKTPNKIRRTRSESRQNAQRISTDKATRSETSFVQEGVKDEPIPDFLKEIAVRKQQAKKDSMPTMPSCSRGTSLHENLAESNLQIDKVWESFYRYYEKKTQEDKSPVILNISTMSCSNNRRFRNAGTSFDSSNSRKDMVYFNHSIQKKSAQQVPVEERTENLHKLIDKMTVQTQTTTDKHSKKSKIPLFRRSAIRKSNRIADIIEIPTPCSSPGSSIADSEELSPLMHRPNIFDSLEPGKLQDVLDFSEPSIDISVKEKPWRFSGDGMSLDQIRSGLNLMMANHFDRLSNGLDLEKPTRPSGKRVSKKFYSKKSLAAKRRAHEENEGLLLTSPRKKINSSHGTDTDSEVESPHGTTSRRNMDPTERDQEKRALKIMSSQRKKTTSKAVQDKCDLEMETSIHDKSSRNQEKRALENIASQTKKLTSRAVQDKCDSEMETSVHDKSSRNQEKRALEMIASRNKKSTSRAVQDKCDSEMETSVPNKSSRNQEKRTVDIISSQSKKTTSRTVQDKCDSDMESPSRNKSTRNQEKRDSEIDSTSRNKSTQNITSPEPVLQKRDAEVGSSQTRQLSRITTPSPSEPILVRRDSVESGISPLGSPFQRSCSAADEEIPETQELPEERSQRSLEKNSNFTNTQTTSATTQTGTSSTSRKKSKRRKHIAMPIKKKPKKKNNNNDESATSIKSLKGRGRSKKTTCGDFTVSDGEAASQRKTSSKSKKTAKNATILVRPPELDPILENNLHTIRNDSENETHGRATASVTRQNDSRMKKVTKSRSKSVNTASTELDAVTNGEISVLPENGADVEDNLVTLISPVKNPTRNNLFGSVTPSASSQSNNSRRTKTTKSAHVEAVTELDVVTRSKTSEVDQGVNELETDLEPPVRAREYDSQITRNKVQGCRERNRRYRAEISEVNIVPTEDGKRPQRAKRSLVSRMDLLEISSSQVAPVRRTKSKAPPKPRTKRGKKQVTEEVPLEEPHDDLPQVGASQINLPEINLMPPPNGSFGVRVRKDLTSDSGFNSTQKQKVGGYSLRRFAGNQDDSEMPGCSSDCGNLDRLSGGVNGIDSSIQHAFRGSLSNESSELDSIINQTDDCMSRLICKPPSNDQYLQLDNFFICEKIRDPEKKYSFGYMRILSGDRKRTASGKHFTFIYTVQSGRAQVLLENLKRLVKNGESFCVPRGKKYSIINVSNQTELLLCYVRMSVTI